MNVTEIKPDSNTTSNVVTFDELIERALSDPSTSNDRLDKLFEMRERELERQAKTEFRSAFAKAQKEIDPIKRKHKAHQNKYKYVKLEDVLAITDPIMVENGFSTSFNTAESHLPNHYRVTCTLMHEGSHEEIYKADIPIDNKGSQGSTNKTDVQGFGSAMSYGRRYLLCLIWNIATPDDNDGQRPIEFITDQQAEELKSIAVKNDVNVKAFCEWAAVGSIDEIPVQHYQDAKDALLSKGQQ